MGRNSKQRRDAKKKNRPASAATHGRPVTPNAASIRRSPTASADGPAEAIFISWAMDAWQASMHRLPATHCSAAVLTLIEVYAAFGLTAEPIAARIDATWPGTNLALTVGSMNPTWKGSTWTGHVGLWVEGLNKFIDPTAYQVNRPGVPNKVTGGLMVTLPSHPSLWGPETVTVGKDGVHLEYTFLRQLPADWAAHVPTLATDECRHIAATIIGHFDKMGRTDEDTRRMFGRVTFPPMVAQLRARGLVA